MILYNLKCRKAHVFEAWFRDSAAYEDQVKSTRVVCPVCGSKKVEKAPMAPRLAKGKTAAELDTATTKLKALRQLRRKIEDSFDYVGPSFAEEARKIHYREADPRNIYGETTEEDARGLSEEGISFRRVPWPATPDS